MAFGGGCRIDAWRAFEQRFAIPIREVYGMTEASSFTTINHDGVVGSVGRPVPWFDVVLLDTDGAPVGDGQAGEIVVVPKRPGLLTAGYLGDLEATSRLLANGRLHSGDLVDTALGQAAAYGRFADGDLASILAALPVSQLRTTDDGHSLQSGTRAWERFGTGDEQ